MPDLLSRNTGTLPNTPAVPIDRGSWFSSRFVTTRANLETVGFLVIVSAVLFAAVIPWHVTNQHVPIWDGANFVTTALNIRDKFAQSLWQGFGALYSDRGWRPIIFPNAASPFFMLFGGAIRASVAASMYWFALITSIYVFFYIRDVAGPVRAVVGTTLVFTLAWFNGYTTLFYSEMMWLAATAGVVYHLTTALRGSLRHFVAAGLWFGAMGAVRPVDTCAIAALPVMALVARGWMTGAVRTADLLILIAQLVLTGAAVALKILPGNHDLVVVALIIAATALIAWRARRFFVDSPLLIFLILAETIAVAWHLPTMRALFLWAYDTSFGSLGQTTDQKFSGLSLIMIVGRLLSHYSPVVLSTLAVISVMSLVGLRKEDFQLARGGPIVIIIGAILMAVPIVLLMAASGTSDTRRVMPAILVAYIGFVALCLKPDSFLQRTRFAMVALLAALQFIAILSNEFGIRAAALERLQTYTGALQPPETSPDGNQIVLDGLLSLGVRSGVIAGFTYCYFSPVDNCENNNLTWFEPIALETIARERHLAMNVNYFVNVDFSKPETLAQQIRTRSFDYVLIDMYEPPTTAVAVPVTPYTEMLKKLIALNRGPLPTGLKSRGCFILGRPLCMIEVAK